MPAHPSKAMILAAGLGTRLRPLTEKRPKALVPVANRAAIDRVIDYLKGHGIREVIVNAHHHHEQVVRHLDGGRPYGIRVEVRVEEGLLGTGGGIKNTEDFWNDAPFIVVNGDTLTDIDLPGAYETHFKRGGLATLVLHDQTPFNQIAVDDTLRILDISEENRPERLAFAGIHIIEPALLHHLTKGVFSSIIDCYRRLIRGGERIGAHISSGHKWWDIGSIEGYRRANQGALAKSRFVAGEGCAVHPEALLEDWVILGDGCTIGKGARIIASILWEHVRVVPGARVENGILTAFQEVRRDVVNEVR